VTPTKPYIFTALQQRFIEEYPKDCKKAAAARRAGCEPSNARQQGYEWYLNPHIKAAIDERMAQLTMSADEAAKHNSDIAATRVNDFMVIRQVQGYVQTEQYVTVLITHAREEIKQLEAFIGRNRLTKEHRAPFDDQITALFGKISEYEIMVHRFGDDVTLLAPGRPVVSEYVDFDLVKMAKAKSTGRIKKFKHTKEGVEIEMYDVQKALDNVFKLNSRFVTKLDLTTKGESLNAPADARAALLSKLAEGQE
jgi:phage terminase small subunit